MAATSRRTEYGAFSRSISPSGRVFSGAGAGAGGGRYSSGAAFNSTVASSASVFSPCQSYTAKFLHNHSHRGASPTRVNLIRSSSGQFLNPIAPKRGPISAAPPRKTCMCSPTTHPGSFRCRLHKGFGTSRGGLGGVGHHRSASSPSNRLNARRSAMTNSCVRIGTVEGELVKRALAVLIRPSSHQQRRRAVFQPRPSRLSVVSKAGDD